MSTLTTRQARERRHRRIRGKVAGTAERPRLAVFRSNKGIFAQLIDDECRPSVSATSASGSTPRRPGRPRLPPGRTSKPTCSAALARRRTSR